MLDGASIAFNRNLDQLAKWCISDDRRFRCWVAEVENGRQVFADTFNIARHSFEHNVNPLYSNRINFGFLDTGNLNLPEYGPYKVRFRVDAVAHRASFLETNCYYFCAQHKIVGPQDVPAGYRATWKDRRLLAEAKLGGKLSKGMSDDDLEQLLLLREPDSVNPADFLEAHIYESVHISAIESVTGPAPSEDDKPIWRHVRKVLRNAGAEVEVVP